MNEDRNRTLHTLLKRDDKDMFFQFTRSSDDRVIKCKILKNEEQKLAKGVARIVEYDMKNRKDQINAPFSDNILDHFFSFTTPQISSDGKNEPGVYHTTCKALPGRDLQIHTNNDKNVMTTNIGGMDNTGVLGVHVTIDIPSGTVPLLRAITIYGYNKHHRQLVSENLSIKSYIVEFGKLYLSS